MGKAYNVHIHDLIVLQNKAVRIVHGVPPRTNAQKLCFDSNIFLRQASELDDSMQSFR